MNIKKILGYALGPIGSAAFGILSLPLISWYYPAEDIGRIVLLQTIAGLSILLLGLGLDQSYIRDYYAVKRQGCAIQIHFFIAIDSDGGGCGFSVIDKRIMAV